MLVGNLFNLICMIVAWPVLFQRQEIIRNWVESVKFVYMNQKIVVIVGTALILSVGGYFAFKYYQRMKIDESVVPIDEALAMLQKAKDQSK